MTSLDVLVLSPTGTPDSQIPIAGSRAGAIGVLDLSAARDIADAATQLDRLAASGRRGRLGVRLPADDEQQLTQELISLALDQPVDGLDVIVTSAAGPGLDLLVGRARDRGLRTFVVISSVDQARAAETAGVDGVLAKGNEAAGWVGEEGSFVLLQRCIAALSIPVWAYGGVGLHTAAACLTGGATGVVLDTQLLLTRESPLPKAVQGWLSAADGSETVSLGADLDARVRVFARPGLAGVERLRALEVQLAVDRDEQAVQTWRAAVAEVMDWRGLPGTVPAFGQDLCFAQNLASRFGTVGGVVAAIAEAATAQCRSARRATPFAEGAPLAAGHGTRFPIVQGPMTRVSDRAGFAAAVGAAGALPFLALSLLRGGEVSALIEQTRVAVGDRPWGVGILAFVPPELRAEQQAAVRAGRPPFALLAGGRPDQAAELEADGIATYLHAPSPGLLAMYMRDGARRFVFEGRECGGHVGPRSSFVLWESAVQTLLEASIAGPRSPEAPPYDVLFAGGVHDGRSAAMVAAMAAPLVEQGMRIGVLLGTAYLFTREIVSTGAVTQHFQDIALGCTSTALLESGPGHVTRCVPSPYAGDFARQRRALLTAGLSAEALRERLEAQNIGRLRIAVKGVDRSDSDGVRAFQPVDEAGQWDRGLYMIGQVAALRNAVGGIEQLHHDVSAGSTAHLSRLPIDEPRVVAVANRPADVAVVGIGAILPGAPDLTTYWANILGGVDAIEEVPASRWDWRNYFDADRSKPDKIYSRWGGFIGDVPFDPVEFGMPPSSLRSIEPFQLLGLVTARAALRDAGYLDRPFARERTSVMLGAGGGGADLVAGYMVRSTLPALLGEPDPDILQQLGDLLPRWTEDSFPGLLMNVAAGRIANRLDLGGGNFTVDAACGSSLAAVVLGVRDLQAGTSDMVLAGGVDAIQNPFAYLCFSKTQALSPTGRCRPFDAHADGIAISEGYAIVALKRLADAERDGDRVYAVIRGAGSASDGRDRSLTAPRPEGQMRALRRAYAEAGFSPASVGLIEAHGTGTVAGDRAEIEALTTVFTQAGAQRQATAIGSVKSMIGHTKATAGVAGLIKACLALHSKVLPPTLGVTQPNPRAEFPASPFYVNSATRPWVRGESARRAGVSAFGFGGTNFHVVLEEHTGAFLDEDRPATQRLPAELLVWRGSTRVQVGTDIRALLTQLDAGARPQLASLAGILAARAVMGSVRLSVVVRVTDSIAERLRAALDVLDTADGRHHGKDGISLSDDPLTTDGRIAFLFPGQGSQQVGMLRELVSLFPIARRCFDHADELLRADLGKPLSGYVFPPPTFVPADAAGQVAALTATDVAQPALGVTELAALHLLRSFGVEPEMTAGHSYGELVALAAAGRLSEDDMLRLSAARGRFIAEEAGDDTGAMAAVKASPDELTELLRDVPGLVLANLNAPRQTVVSGTSADIESTVAWSRERRIGARTLPVACAFHSPLVAPAQHRLADVLSDVPLSPDRVPVFSNTTGKRYPADAAAARALLAEHLARPVDFVSEIRAMHGDGARIFVEVGPGSVLTALVGEILGDRPHLTLTLDPPSGNGLFGLLSCLGGLFVEGAPVILERLFDGREIERLNLSALAAGSVPLSASTWLVNGGRARPAAESADRPSASVPAPALPVQPRPPSATEVPMTGNGSVHTLDHDNNGAHTNNNGAHTNNNGAHTNNNGAPTNNNGAPTNNNGAPTDSNGAHTNGAHSTIALPHVTVPVVAAPQVPVAFNAAPPPYAPVGPDRVAEVMNRYQQVMGQFLETQRSVMLTYLGQPATGADSYRPAPVRQLRAIAAPAPVTSMPTPVGVPPVTAVPTPAVAPVAPGPAPGTAPPAPGSVPSAVSSPPGAAAAPAIATPTTAMSASEQPPTVEPPAVEPPTVVPPTVEPPTVEPPSAEQITEQLLGVVSERTGYPPEMLGLDAQLEADLGIDSIKRVEMAGLIMAALPMPPDAASNVEIVTSARTLREVVTALQALLTPASVPPEQSSLEPAADREPLPFPREPTDAGRIGRLVLQVSPAPKPAATAALARSGVVLVVAGVDDPVARVLEHRLRERQECVLVVPAVGGEETDVQVLVADVQRRHDRIKAVVVLPDDAGSVPTAAGVEARVTNLFVLIRGAQDDLARSAADGGAAVLVGSAVGHADDLAALTGAGTIEGFLRTLAVEQPDVRCKAVEFDADGSPEQAADQLLVEFLADDGAVAVNYSGGERRIPVLATRPVQHRTAQQPLPSCGVVLLTGGARGITAVAAGVLARLHRPTLVIAGRTEVAAEDPRTALLDDPRTLRGALVEQLRAAGGSPTPAQVEARYRRLLAVREVRSTLSRLKDEGAEVDYRACDVQDAAAFGTLLDDVYRTYGRIDGVVHGAGVIEDRLIRDKSSESFRRVLRTKLVPALVLAERLDPEALRFLVFFSSIASRFGNRGQADYAAANGALDRLAAELDRRWPARVVSIGWGPWAAGMVAPQVQQQFIERGVELLSVRQGSILFEQELSLGRKGEADVVLAAGTSGAAGPSTSARAARPDRPLFAVDIGGSEIGGSRPAGLDVVRRFDLAQDRYLDHHRIGGRPVVPFAVALELMAEAAEQTAGAPICGADAVRLLRGIRLDDDRSVAAAVTTTPAHDSSGTVAVALASPDKRQHLHYTATFRLAPHASGPSSVDAPPLVAAPTSATVSELYARYLFHGPLLQGICRLDKFGPAGASALLSGSPPAELITGSETSGPWILDPRVIDSALQVQVLWARLHWDTYALPTELVSLDIREPGRGVGGGGPVRHEMRIGPDSAKPRFVADHWLFDDATGELLAVLKGMTGIGSSSLNRIIEDSLWAASAGAAANPR